MNSSDQNAITWHNKIFNYLSKYGDYVPVIVEPLQLVGVCLFVFVLKKHAGAIKEVCVEKNKTGLGGNAGNKGGVLLRFIFYNTSMCFVCSHFAAHQKEIKQRNDDFAAIYNTEFTGPQVPPSAKIETMLHDYIFWCGDLNYRIDLDNDRCRRFIAECDYDSLFENEQLLIQRREENVFRGFQEAPLYFPPTYKYNLREDTYDRSEKCRVPAWTDRVLWKRRILSKADLNNEDFNHGRCLYYGRADIRLSDHR
jgi:synaptojanin